MDALKLAKQIVKDAEAKYGNARYGDSGRQIDTIVADADEWIELIHDHLTRSKPLLVPCKDGKRHWWKNGWVCSKCGMRYIEYQEKVAEAKAKLDSSE